MGNSLLKNFFQIWHWGISIGIRLEIGDIFVDWTFSREHSNLTVNLFRNGKRRACGKIAAASLAAEDTAAVSNGAVTVRAAHTAV